MDELLECYKDELSAFHGAADEFSRVYPRVAGQLRLGATGADDPHVERLIQAFAFLTARVQKQLNDDLPDFAQAMLEVLYPQQLAPTPSMTIVQLELDPQNAQLRGGHRISRHTELETESVGGQSCRYRTAWEETLWPVMVSRGGMSLPPFGIPAEYDHPSAVSMLRLSLRTFGQKTPFSALTGLDSLRLFLDGQPQYVYDLYELLCNNVVSLHASWRNGEQRILRRLDPQRLAPVPFESGNELLPVSDRVPHAVQLLREYFVFPQRFLFFRLSGLGEVLAECSADELELVILLNRRLESAERFVSENTFRTGCVPAVNLFPVVCEPIRLDHQDYEYRIVPDVRRGSTWEVFTVEKVAVVDGNGDERPIEPLYSLQHSDVSGTSGRFWTAARKQRAMGGGREGSVTDLFLSIVDPHLNPHRKTGEVLNVEVLCLSGDLPAQLPWGGGSPQLIMRNPGPVGRTTCLVRPVDTRRQFLRRGVLWRMISQLSLNHLNISGGTAGANSLREYLRVHDCVRPLDDPFPFDGIVSVASRRLAARIRPDSSVFDQAGDRPGEAGFARGVQISLELDEQRFVGVGSYLFASVLEQFFALQVPINSFTSLVYNTRQRREVRRWPPRTGEHRL